jgi:hypothetical protein
MNTNELLVDIATHDLQRCIYKLNRLVSTTYAMDGGMYTQDRTYSQLHIDTIKTADEVDQWLYKHGFDYVGVTTR